MSAEHSAKAVELVRQREQNGKGFYPRAVVPNIGGGLVVYVDYREDDEDLYSLVFFHNEAAQVFDNDEEFLKHLSAHRSSGGAASVLKQIAMSSGVAGLIAVVITFAICYMVVVREKPVPSELWAALSLILGFYFGTKNKKFGEP